MSRLARLALTTTTTVIALLCGGCADTEEEAVDILWTGEVEAFVPGEAAGFGATAMPGVVQGPPGDGSTISGSLDVVSLGVGGEVVLGFGERVIVDGPGADFVVFENAFWPGGDAAQVFAELGEVAVSLDGEHWTAFPCRTEPSSPGRWPGCAGWSPTLDFNRSASALDPTLTGGDAFDLAELGLAQARYVRIRDLSQSGAAPSAGFDLDAVGLVHSAPR